MSTINTLSSPPLPPGSFGLPLIGETLSMLQDPLFAQKRHQKYGPVFKTKLYGRPTIFLSGAEANRFVLTHENQYFSNNLPQSTKVLLGPAALSVQTGVEHQRTKFGQALRCRQLLLGEIEKIVRQRQQEAMLKEVLRVVPPVGGGFREVIKPCEFNGYCIPQGWSVIYQIGRTHQDSSIYHQPERFLPERFGAQGAYDKPLPFSYVPFGGGIRECLGKEFAKLEMKIFAALLVRYYEWELLPEQNLELVMVPTPHPRDNLQVSFRRLQSKN